MAKTAPFFMKLHCSAIVLVSLAGAVSGFADHFTLSINTAVQSEWTVNSTGATNATPFLFSAGLPTQQVGLSISSRGDGSGIYLNGADFSAFDGYWTATYTFYLPPTATNAVLTYTNVGFDDAGVLFLNSNVIASTCTTASSNGTTDGQIVLVDGGASQSWNFTGPNGQVSGTATNGFMPGGMNTLTAIVNNTGDGPTGVLRMGLPPGDGTIFELSATLSYDVFPGPGSLTIAQYPGLEITGTIGAQYQIQYSTNLTNGTWNTLSNVVLTSSPFLFFDTVPILGNPHRFYRAVAQ